MTKGQTNIAPKKKKKEDHIPCYKCGKTGHYSNACTVVKEAEAEEGKQFLSS